jgi:hypothetical protein
MCMSAEESSSTFYAASTISSPSEKTSYRGCAKLSTKQRSARHVYKVSAPCPASYHGHAAHRGCQSCETKKSVCRNPQPWTTRRHVRAQILLRTRGSTLRFRPRNHDRFIATAVPTPSPVHRCPQWDLTMTRQLPSRVSKWMYSCAPPPPLLLLLLGS